VWSEIRRLNAELSMTIFLTTQYLEEADELAGRVGILSAGHLVAEGTPAQLKRSLGGDAVVVEVDGDDPAALSELAALSVVDDVQGVPGKITIDTPDAPRAMAPIAQVLGASVLTVRSLTLKTPSLDDVFMALTGSRLENETSP
jgi:ABC-2 type transport system ATP-binding protein